MMRAACRAAGGLLAIVIARHPLRAQDRVTDAGFAVVRFPEDDRWIVGPWLRASAQRDAPEVRSRASATVIASPSALSGFADAAASRRGETGIGALSWEAGTEADALVGRLSQPRGTVLAMGRLLHPVRTGGVWLRGAQHIARRESGASSGRSIEAGGWWRASHVTFTAAITRQWAQGQLFSGDAAVGVVPVRYVEGTLGARSAGAWGSLDASLGARRDPDATQRVERSWSVNALVQRSPRMGVILGIARQPADYVRGADAMQSVSVGLRFASRDAEASPATREGAVVDLLVSSASAARTLRIRMPGAHAVEVMGDFTDWQAELLTPSGGDFLLAGRLAPGTHRVMVRIDGGPWVVPANTPAVDDDLGGRVGLLVVP